MPKLVSQSRWILMVGGMALLVLAHFAAQIFRVQSAVSLWFPPSGVAIVLALWLGPVAALLVWCVSFFMAPLWGVEGLAQIASITDASEPLVAWLLYRYFWRGSLNLNSLKDAVIFIGSAPLAACFTSAVLGSLVLTALGQIPVDRLTMSILNWWLGNALGVMTIVPPLLLLLTPALQRQGWIRHRSKSNPSIDVLSSWVTFAPSASLHTVHEPAAIPNEFIPHEFIPDEFIPDEFVLSEAVPNEAILNEAILNEAIPTVPQRDAVTKQQRFCRTTRFWLEVTAIALVSITTAILTVSHIDSSRFIFQQFSFLNFVAVIWAAARFGAIGGSLTASFCMFSSLVTYLVIYPYALTVAFFPVDPEALYIHKLSLLIQSGVGLLVGASVTQQAAMQVALAVERVRAKELQKQAELSQQLVTLSYSLAEANTHLHQSNQEKDDLLRREQTARTEAESANRVKDEFLAVLSHELRSPLNPILGWASLLRSREFDTATLQRALEIIERNAKLQTQLIEDLLDVSRILRGKLSLNLTSVQLADVIVAAIETVQPMATSKEIAIDTHLDTTLEPINGDAIRLQQVVWNLLSNAVKFTPLGGQIDINLGNTRVNDRRYAQIIVKDTGKGISPDFLPHVFEQFRQEDSSTTRKFGGLGLGLAIVRHVVELHGGWVQADSAGENQGATFKVLLPMESLH